MPSIELARFSRWLQRAASPFADYNRTDWPQDSSTTDLCPDPDRDEMRTDMLPLIVGITTAVILIAAILVLWTWIIRSREMVSDEDTGMSDDLTDFREMHEQGALDDDEFSRLKKIISDQSNDREKNKKS